MASTLVLSGRVTEILACVKLSYSIKDIESTEENSIITEIIRKSNAYNLIGGSGESTIFAEIKQWMSLSQDLTEEDLIKINACLLVKSYLVGHSYTISDVAVFVSIKNKFINSLVNYPEICRWYDHIQSICITDKSEIKQVIPVTNSFICVPNNSLSAQLSSSLSTVKDTVKDLIVPTSSSSSSSSVLPVVNEAKEVKKEDNKETNKENNKEFKKEDKKDAKKEEKKEKKSAAPAVAVEVEELDPSKLDIRIGLIVKCWDHPESDKRK